jgi:ribosomal protein S18 acetylase RimI-like enzyme
MKIDDIVISVAIESDIPAIKELFLEYARAIGIDLCFQNFDKELANLPGKYALPDGALLIAKSSGKVCGCVALRNFDDQVCEMKRLYVKPEFRKIGLGKDLVKRIISEAKKRGYKFMRLDTLATMQSAIKLYESFGFYEIPAYTFNPISGAVYMELKILEKA